MGRAAPHPQRPRLDQRRAARLAAMALQGLRREYPHKPSAVLGDDRELLPPRRHTPAFFGCFDWHSAVHTHWLLLRLAGCFPRAEFTSAAWQALKTTLTPAHLEVELAQLQQPGNEGFERPYGLAWLLQLAAELRARPEAPLPGVARSLAPLERLAAERLRRWAEELPYPVRHGEHGLTAFALALLLDWDGDTTITRVIRRRSRRFFSGDRDYPLHYEPSGEDFFSPGLAEADLMRRVLAPADFSVWLDAFLPSAQFRRLPQTLKPARAGNRGDGRLVHIDGLNLSRAWMLEGIASALPAGDTRVAPLLRCALLHGRRGLAALPRQRYAGSHWLASFAGYYLGRSGQSTFSG